MNRLAMVAGVALTIVVAAAPANALVQDAEPARVQEYQLDNGVRVVNVYVPGANRQVTFSCIPVSMGDEPDGQAQWSHLLEHMMIRSTDAFGLEADGMSFNGETNHTLLRLETIAEVPAWRDSVERHARWLAVDTFPEEVLAREKQNVQREIDGTAAARQTYKWSVAAWNQVVRHGRDHAAVARDVHRARAEEIAVFAKQSCTIGDNTWLFTIGPVDPGQVKDDIAATVGMIDRSAEVRQPAATLARDAGALRGTWDVPTRHVLAWWIIEPDADGDIELQDLKAAIDVISYGAFAALMQQRSEMLPTGGIVFSGIDAGERMHCG
ncbi:MAG: hypothetical protein ACR2GY_12090 [Phycisphaerales bacterium]